MLAKKKYCLQVTILPKLPRPPPEALAILFHQSSPWRSDEIETLSWLVILLTWVVFNSLIVDK